MILLKNGKLISPDPEGKKDILLSGGTIAGISETIEPPAGIETESVDFEGLLVLPGLIDGHVHFAGAGGEGGPSTRTPEMPVSDIVEGGVTTAVGMLGTDGITRAVESVLMKARSLSAQGITAYILSGAYQVPTPTITGDLGRDITLISEVIGAGEIAVSDHRDSVPQWHELARLIRTVRVAGMLAGKAGIVCVHLGEAPRTFEILLEVVEKANIPWRNILPTHCNRSEAVFELAVDYARRGGFVDITTSAYPFFPDEEAKPSSCIGKLLASGVPSHRISLSSDAGGSLPEFDEAGNLTGYEIGKVSTIYSEIVDLVTKENMPINQAVRFATSNPAAVYGLRNKGRVAAGCDADLLVIDEKYEIQHVIAGGRFLIRDKLNTDSLG